MGIAEKNEQVTLVFTFLFFLQVNEAFHEFNIFSTLFSESLWYLDPYNETEFFIKHKDYAMFLSPIHMAVIDNQDLFVVKFFLDHLAINKLPGK